MNNCVGEAHILLAIPEAEERGGIERFLSKDGWQCESASDSGGLLLAVERGSYDLVIADLELPGMEAVDLLRAIRRSRPGQAIIAVSRACDLNHTIQILKEGVSDYLEKPIDLDRLEYAVVRALGGVRLREEREDVLLHMTAQTTEYVFSAWELSRVKFSLEILELLYRAGRLSLDDKLRVELGFQEALANSLEHGNLELNSAWKERFGPEGIDHYTMVKHERLKDPHYSARKIHIQTIFARNSLTLRIKDEGPGFLVDEYLSARQDPARLLCYGRGMALLVNGFDEVSYQGRGTEVTLVKYLMPQG